MKPDGKIKLVADLLDLPLIDSDGCYCGIVDDVEFGGTKELKLKTLLVGPGTYEQRMPGWLYWVVQKIAGDRIVWVPMEKIRSVASAVTLDCPGSELGLQRSEKAAARWLPKWGAM